jgi:ribosomal protein S18 acetylase RimI-like enzyme
MSIEIAPIDVHDAASFHACLDVVARERKYLAMFEAPPLESVAAFVADNVAHHHPQLVARDGERVVGWCDIVPRWQHAWAHCGTVGMGVLPEFRGKGLGPRLLRACIAAAVERGITRIELDVRVDNHRAIRLYEQQGFRREALRVHGMRVDGEYVDALAMALLVEGSA